MSCLNSIQAETVPARILLYIDAAWEPAFDIFFGVNSLTNGWNDVELDCEKPKELQIIFARPEASASPNPKVYFSSGRLIDFDWSGFPPGAKPPKESTTHPINGGSLLAILHWNRKTQWALLELGFPVHYEEKTSSSYPDGSSGTYWAPGDGYRSQRFTDRFRLPLSTVGTDMRVDLTASATYVSNGGRVVMPITTSGQLEPAPPLFDVVAKGLLFESLNMSFAFEVRGKPLPSDVTLHVYWVFGDPDFGTAIDQGATPIYTETVAAGAFGRVTKALPPSIFQQQSNTHLAVRLEPTADEVNNFNNESFLPVSDLNGGTVKIDQTNKKITFTPGSWRWIPHPTTAAIYWASGPSFAKRVSDVPISWRPVESPRSSQPLEISVPLSSLDALPPGATHLVLMLDPDNLIAEWNEENNEIALSPLDLIAGSLQFNSQVGGLDFDYTVQGPLNPPAVGKVFWGTGPGTSRLGDNPVLVFPIPIGAGSGQKFHIPSTVLAGAPAAATHLVVVLDPDNAVSENSEINNDAYVILQSLLLDIDFSDPQANNGAMPDDTWSVMVSFKNITSTPLIQTVSLEILLIDEKDKNETLVGEFSTPLFLQPAASQTQSFAVKLKPGDSFPMDSRGFRRFKARINGNPKTAATTSIQRKFFMGRIIHVLTHGFNPFDPFWDSFLNPWRKMADVLEPSTFSPFYRRTKQIQRQWDSTTDFRPAFGVLFAAKFADAYAIYEREQNSTELAVLFTDVSAILKNFAKSHVGGSGSKAQSAADQVFSEVKPELARGYPKFLVVHLVGHSRGGAVNARVNRLLEKAGKPADYFVSLDGYSTDWPDDGGLIGDIHIVTEASSASNKFNVRVDTPISGWIVDLVEAGTPPEFLINAAAELRKTDPGIIRESLLLMNSRIREILRGMDLRAPHRDGFKEEIWQAHHVNITEKYADSAEFSGFYDQLEIDLDKPPNVIRNDFAKASVSAREVATGFVDGSFEEAGQLMLRARNLPALPDGSAFIQEWLWAVQDPRQALAGWDKSGDIQLVTKDGASWAHIETTRIAVIGQYIAVSVPESFVRVKIGTVQGADDGELLLSWGQQQLSVPLQKVANSELKLDLHNSTGYGAFYLYVGSKTGAKVAVDVDDFRLVGSELPQLVVVNSQETKIMLRLSKSAARPAWLQFSTNLKDWSDLGAIGADVPTEAAHSAGETAGFYRVRFE
ncbi:MAG: hypothetical protein L0387_25900 [Acidobacteria bacterium]|nr:hypothetical protein [Acidobacteriota bacterium]